MNNSARTYLWPEVFQDPNLVYSEDPRALCASALYAWGNCMVGNKPPDNFGEVLVSIRARLGMEKAATAENIMEHAKAMGWIE